MGAVLRIDRPNARFQQWEALLGNRAKRRRLGEFLVQGVRPVSLALEHGWTTRAVLYDSSRPLSRWATGVLDRAAGVRVAMAPDLLRLLSEKDEDAAELVAVVEMPADDLSRIPVGPAFLGAAFDRPAGPGNIGALARSLDAFAGAGLILTGHGADPYDPRSIRASTGSMFALPVVGAATPGQVMAWARPHGLVVVGLDEQGTTDIPGLDLTRPTLFVVGNERTGLSAAWREECDVLARIPMGGSASSLNAATAGTVALYEASRQRGLPR